MLHTVFVSPGDLGALAGRLNPAGRPVQIRPGIFAGANPFPQRYPSFLYTPCCCHTLRRGGFGLSEKRNTYTQYTVKAGKERDNAMLRDMHIKGAALALAWLQGLLAAACFAISTACGSVLSATLTQISHGSGSGRRLYSAQPQPLRPLPWQQPFQGNSSV